ncbi:MAG: hypothetical protein QF735_11890, partial [Phycisphaeraceae bacterium]|nr:hypothetical protein [Phycisphaeraceae bacterium]
TPYYLRARVDQQFLLKRKREVAELRLGEYLSKIGIKGEPAYRHIIIGESPFAWDLDDVGVKQRWFDASQRPAELENKFIGRHWNTDHTWGPLPAGWHFVTFDVPADHAGKRVLLHFGAIDGHATVYVNGRHVGAHDGNVDAWDEPFHFDVTNVVRSGNNDLTLRIAPCMQLGGPFRPISVIVL